MSATNPSLPAESFSGPHDSLPRRLLHPAPRLELLGICHPGREEVERHVAERYHSAYRARVEHFLPWLLTMECLGLVCGVAGMRPAQHARLFLEQYLDGPVEALLSAREGRAIDRQAIVEVGNLVAARRGASHLLFVVFTAVLHQSGYQWLVFTATRALSNNLEHLGYPLHSLQVVDVTALDRRMLAQWGSYYAAAPTVMAGSLDDAMQIIQRRPLLATVLRLYQPRIDALAARLRGA